MPNRCLVLFAALAVPVGAAAFSGDGPPAKAEKAEKDKQKKPAKPPVKVYTDEDLKNAQGNVTILQASPEPGKAGGEGAHEGAGTATEQEGTPAAGASVGHEDGTVDRTSDRSRNEASWREMARERWAALRSAEKQVADLQAEIDELMLDRNPNPPDLLDPSRLQKREARKAKAIEELAVAKQALATAQQGLEDLRRRAAEAGAPVFWLDEPRTPETDRG